jgi:hypothetical protein
MSFQQSGDQDHWSQRNTSAFNFGQYSDHVAGLAALTLDQRNTSAFGFGQNSDRAKGFAALTLGQRYEYPSGLMEDEIGPHYKDYDDEGFIFVNDALQRLEHPLSLETREEFRQRLVQHFENPERYPTRFWLRDYLHFEGVVDRHDPRWITKYGAWSQHRNRPSEDESYPDFRRKMVLRLMTRFRKDELEYTLAYWRHYPLNDDDDPKIHGLFHHLFTKAMQDDRYNPDDTNKKAGYRLIMALLLGAADKVPWIRDYWAFNPYRHGGDTSQDCTILDGQGGPQHFPYLLCNEDYSDPPQVGNILRGFGSVNVHSDTVWYIGETQTTPARLFRIQMLRAYAEDRRNMLLGAYWRYHKICEDPDLDAGFITDLFIRKFSNEYRVQSGPTSEDYAREQRRKRSLALDEEAAFSSMSRALID